MKNFLNKPNTYFVFGAFLILIGAIFTPQQPVRTSPLFWSAFTFAMIGFVVMWVDIDKIEKRFKK